MGKIGRKGQEPIPLASAPTAKKTPADLAKMKQSVVTFMATQGKDKMESGGRHTISTRVPKAQKEGVITFMTDTGRESLGAGKQKFSKKAPPVAEDVKAVAEDVKAAAQLSRGTRRK